MKAWKSHSSPIFQQDISVMNDIRILHTQRLVTRAGSEDNNNAPPITTAGSTSKRYGINRYDEDYHPMEKGHDGWLAGHTFI